METNFTPWNDDLEIEGDAREFCDAELADMHAEFVTERHAEDSFEENLNTPEEIAEYEEFDGGDMDGDHGSALESVYGPND